MASIEYNLEHADELEQTIISNYGKLVDAGHGASLTVEFKALFEKATEYRMAKLAGAEVQIARQAFAEACKNYEEKLTKRAAG